MQELLLKMAATGLMTVLGYVACVVAGEAIKQAWLKYRGVDAVPGPLTKSQTE
jgi:hypothetical protein